MKEHKPAILGISGLLMTTIPKMLATIAALKDGGLREQVKVIVGGAPVSEAYANEIGADAHGPPVASQGVALAAVGTLAKAGDHAATLGIDCHLAAVDEMRALARLAAQPGLGVASRDRGAGGAGAFGRLAMLQNQGGGARRASTKGAGKMTLGRPL